MNRLKSLIVLIFAAAFAAALISSRTVNSQQGQSPSTYPNTPLTASQSAALAALTNQADKVSGTGVTVSASAPAGVADEGLGAFTFNPHVNDPTNPQPTPPVNVALATNGGVATASSFYIGGSGTYPPEGANNGDRKGVNWGSTGGWNDATRDVFPDWLQIDFNGSKTLGEIRVFTLQDDFNNPQEPNQTMTATFYGLLDFDVQSWDGAQWVTVPGGVIRGNDKVMRVIGGLNVTTTKIRVNVLDARSHFSRIVELEAYLAGPSAPTEAPAGFDNQPVPDFFPGTTAEQQAAFDAALETFEERDIIDDGLGPVYNAQACAECHQDPVTGGISQIGEHRAGHNDLLNNFIDAPGGSLINDRAINAKVHERVPPLFTAGIVGNGDPIAAEEPVRTFRTSLNLLGDGFVEAIPNGTLLDIAAAQAANSNGQVQGQAIAVPVLEANFLTNRDCADPNQACVRRIGRFGWKDQIPSLLSFSGDAYVNEIGITNFLILNENTSLGRSVAAFDTVSDTQLCEEPLCPVPQNCPCGEDTARDIETFTEFMRATMAPPQDKDIQNDPRFAADISAGRQLFFRMPAGPSYSCSICHVPAIVTAQPGTAINGGQFTVPASLGFKIIRPFSDFLLHDVGTGDGIVQNGGQSTRTKVRTPALWGVRTRTRLMHDGDTRTFREAILRHQGEATAVTAAFQLLTEQQKRQLIMFLESL